MLFRRKKKPVSATVTTALRADAGEDRPSVTRQARRIAALPLIGSAALHLAAYAAWSLIERPRPAEPADRPIPVVLAREKDLARLLPASPVEEPPPPERLEPPMPPGRPAAPAAPEPAPSAAFEPLRLAELAAEPEAPPSPPPERPPTARPEASAGTVPPTAPPAALAEVGPASRPLSAPAAELAESPDPPILTEARPDPSVGAARIEPAPTVAAEPSFAPVALAELAGAPAALAAPPPGTLAPPDPTSASGTLPPEALREVAPGPGAEHAPLAAPPAPIASPSPVAAAAPEMEPSSPVSPVPLSPDTQAPTPAPAGTPQWMETVAADPIETVEAVSAPPAAVAPEPAPTRATMAEGLPEAAPSPAPAWEIAPEPVPVASTPPGPAAAPDTAPPPADAPVVAETLAELTAEHAPPPELPFAPLAALPPTVLDEVAPTPERSAEGEAGPSVATLPGTMPPVPDRDSLDATQDRIEAAIRQVDCGRVAGHLLSAPGALYLSGHVPSNAERTRLIRRLAAIPGVTSVDDHAVVTLPRPHCAVLDLFERAGVPISREQTTSVAMLGDAGQAGILRFRAGELLTVHLTAPDYPAHVYVDYYDRAGKVYHLLPSPVTPRNRFAAKQRLQLGGIGGLGRRITIAPPYGLDLLVAFAASKPLFAEQRPEVEDANEYLAHFADALAATRREHPGLQAEFFYLFVLTQR